MLRAGEYVFGREKINKPFFDNQCGTGDGADSGCKAKVVSTLKVGGEGHATRDVLYGIFYYFLVFISA